MMLPCMALLLNFVKRVNIVITICTAGAVACTDNMVAAASPSVDHIDHVAERLLEPVPIEDSGPVSVQGRLHKHADFWLNELDASSFVKDIVLYGYRIPFVVLPWPVFKNNHRSALKHEGFVISAIEELAA